MFSCAILDWVAGRLASGSAGTAGGIGKLSATCIICLMRITRPAVVALTAVTLLLCYAGTIQGMAGQWVTDEDMGHGATAVSCRPILRRRW